MIFPLLADVLRAMVWMEGALKEKNLSITRLKAIFGIKTEKAAKLAALLQNNSKELNQNLSNEENNESDSSSNEETS